MGSLIMIGKLSAEHEVGGVGEGRETMDSNRIDASSTLLTGGCDRSSLPSLLGLRQASLLELDWSVK